MSIRLSRRRQAYHAPLLRPRCGRSYLGYFLAGWWLNLDRDCLPGVARLCCPPSYRYASPRHGSLAVRFLCLAYWSRHLRPNPHRRPRPLRPRRCLYVFRFSRTLPGNLNRPTVSAATWPTRRSGSTWPTRNCSRGPWAGTRLGPLRFSWVSKSLLATALATSIALVLFEADRQENSSGFRLRAVQVPLRPVLRAVRREAHHQRCPIMENEVMKPQ